MAQHITDTSKTKGRGFRKSVLSTDDAAAGPAMEGILRKKNSHGIWQKRYFWVNNFYLNWCGEKKNVSSIKGALNLLEAEEIVAPNRHGDITLTFSDGVKTQLRAKNGSEANEWVACLEHRKDYFSRVAKQATTSTRNVNAASLDTAEEDTACMEGWLQKKSGDYRDKYQERFVKLFAVQGDLQYFKKTRTGEKQCGVVAINNIEWIRPYDESPDCTEFEFLSASRVFRWKAESPAVMRRWIDEIGKAVEVAREMEKNYELARVEANTSSRIIEFDTTEDKAHVVEENVDMIFGSCDGQEVEVLAQAVEYAVDDLLELAADCEAAPGRPARLDILKFQLHRYHERVLVEVQRFFDGRLSDAEQSFLYQLITLICTYSSALSDLSARLPEADRPASPLLSLVGQLSDNFVNGSKGTVTQARRICTTTAERQMREGKDGVHQQADDREFHTATAVDIWENINSQIQLAVRTGAAALQYMVVEGALGAFLEMTQTLTEDLGDPDVVAKRGSEYVCATMNDCTQHMDQLLDLPDMMSDPEIMQRIEPLIDRATRALIAYGDAGVRALSRGVMQDLAATLNKVFSNEWRDGVEDPAATISATMHDYISEYEAVLGDYHHRKLCADLCARAVVAYLRFLVQKLSAQKVPGVKLGGGLRLEPPVINRMFDDLRVIELCFASRVMHAGPPGAPGQQRPGPFVLMDDVKALLSAKEARILDVVRSVAESMAAAAAGAGGGGGGGRSDKVYRESLEFAVTVLLKARQDLNKTEARQLTDACLGAIDDKMGSSGGGEEPGQYDRAELYCQVFVRKNRGGSRASQKRGSIAPSQHLLQAQQDSGAASARFGGTANSIEEDDLLQWMQHADENIQAVRVKSMHADFTAAQEAEQAAAGTTAELAPTDPTATEEAAPHMEGYLEKKPHGSKKWNKRWFTLYKEVQPNGEGLVVLTWSKNPKTPAIHDVRLSPECKDNYTYVAEATEPIVRDSTTGQFFLASELPTATPVKLKSTKMNVMTVMTAERKFKLRGGSPAYILRWVNALNKLLKPADVDLEALMEEDDRRSFALGNTIGGLDGSARFDVEDARGRESVVGSDAEFDHENGGVHSLGSVASVKELEAEEEEEEEGQQGEAPPATPAAVPEAATTNPMAAAAMTVPKPEPADARPASAVAAEPQPANATSSPPTSTTVSGPSSPSSPHRSSLKSGDFAAKTSSRKKSVSFQGQDGDAPEVDANAGLSHSFNFPDSTGEDEEPAVAGRRKEQKRALSADMDPADRPVARCCVVS